MIDTLNFIKKNSFNLESAEKSQLLLQYFNQEHSEQYVKNNLYKKIIDSITPKKTFSSLDEIPFLPVQYFKKAGDKFASSKKVHRSLLSSATSGLPSIIPLDAETSKRQVVAISSVLSDFIGKERRPFLICDFDLEHTTNAKEFTARHAAISGFTNFASSKNFILQNENEKHVVDVEKIKNVIRKNQQPVTICGFSFLVYIYLIKFCKENKIHLPLPKGSSIIHIGGWKKLADQEVGREIFVKDACEVFALEPKNVIDIYGFTEQMGTLYPECEFGHKHTPDFAHLIVRNPYSYKKLSHEEIGVGQFLSLVPKSYTGFSLLTDDLIKITGEDDCKCGRKGITFRVIGRAKSAEIRGCGDIIATKILQKETEINVDLKNRKGVISFFESKIFDEKKIDDWSKIEQQLKSAQKNLSKLSVDEIIGILKEAAKKWRQDTELMEYRYQGVDYIINWIISGQFERILDLSLRGSRAHLDQILKNDLDSKSLTAIARGTVVHWIAGNVPSLGIISILISLVCKNSNIVKLPTSSSKVLQKMLHILSQIEYRTIYQTKLSGKILSDAIAILYIPRGSQDNEILSSLADARIAWGGKEAVSAIVNLPKKYNCEDVVFGPKLSLAVIAKESLENERKAARVARSLAIDASVFDQKACASAHNVFIEEGGNISPEEFLLLLKKRMEEVAIQIPGLGDDFVIFDQIKSSRLDYYLDDAALVIAPNNMQWSILFDKKLELRNPIYGRTVFLHSIKNISDVSSLLSGDNQVVGLALKGIRREKIALQYLKNGVSRITQLGHMADFTFPWDDSFPTEKLIRWCYV